MEASRSTNLSPDSYVGSLISLISKAEIRYEGILFNINTQESSIGLRNVRSFGSEGRKKDGPQVPPSDKVYEYILFRGSDIKDLHVKSSPPVQTTASIYNDPAIIQSHIPQEAATSTSLPYSSTRSQQDFNSYTSQLGFPKSSPQSNAPLYQPGVSLGSWGSSYPLPTTNNIMPAPTYLQGIQGASDGIQTQQQSLLQPPSRLLTPPSVHQTMPYPAMSAPLPSRSSAVPIPPFLDTPSPLLPSFSPTAPNVHSPFLPSHTSALPADSTTVLNPNKGPMQGLRSADMSTTSLQLVTPPTTTLDESVFPTAGAVQPKSAEPTLTFNNILESEQHVSGSSGSFPNRGLAPPLVTPNQFVQPGTAIMPSSRSSQSIQKDVEMVQVSSTIPRLQTIPGAQAPLLPLPTSVDYKIHGDPLYSRHSNRGRGRGRGHWASHNVTNFTEDFDFVSMNEKFNKDEVWGQLGKKNATLEDGYSRDKDNVGKTTSETKPVYVKDDFFDSLSSNATGGSHGGRSIFSEKKKLNTETFGDAARHRVGHGGRGYGRSGHGFDRGGQGFDHRGRGLQMQSPNTHGNQDAPPPQSWGPQSFSMNTGGGHGFAPNHQYAPPPRQFDNYYPPADMPPIEKQPRSGPPAYGRDMTMGTQPNMQPHQSMVTKVSRNMQIPLTYADAVIGTSGTNISYIRRASGATIAIQETRGVPDEMTVEINGSASEVQTAQQLIQNSIADAANAAQNVPAAPGQGYNPYPNHGAAYLPHQQDGAGHAPAGDYGSVYGNYGY